MDLMERVKVCMLSQNGNQNPVLTMYGALATLLCTRRYRHEDLPDYRKRFVTSMVVLEHVFVTYGGVIVNLLDEKLREENNISRAEVS